MRKASRIAINSISIVSLGPYGRPLNVTISRKSFKEGCRNFIGETASLFAFLVGGNACSDASTHITKLRSTMPCSDEARPYWIECGLPWMMISSRKGYNASCTSREFIVVVRF